MLVSSDNILFPSLHAVANRSDLDFFVPAFNHAFGDDVMWLPNEYDWVDADNSISVMAGGSAAAGVLTGKKSSAHLSGLDKTLIVTSKEITLTSKSGDFTVVYNEEFTTNLYLEAESSTAQFFNMSTKGFDLSKFYFEEHSLIYRTDTSNIVFDLQDEAVISLHSIMDTDPIELSYTNGTYQIVQGASSPIVFADSDAVSDNTNEEGILWADNVMLEMDQIRDIDNTEIDTNINDTFLENIIITKDQQNEVRPFQDILVPEDTAQILTNQNEVLLTENVLESEGISGLSNAENIQDQQSVVRPFEDILVPEDTAQILTNQNEVLLTEDVLASEDISGLSNTENIQDHLPKLSSDHELTNLVSDNIYRGLSELLSSVEDDLIFDQVSNTDLYEAHITTQLEIHNDQTLQKSLHMGTFSDLIFENPFDFYDEI
jgi:hypothetical protein